MQRTNRFIVTTLFIFMSLFLVLSLTGVKTAFTRDTQVQISNVRYSNLTDRSVSISWLTETATDGSVSYGTDPNDLTLGTENDDREELYPGFTGTTHHVTIHDLDPDTTYHFSVSSDDGNSMNADDTNVFKTFSNALEPTQPDTSVSGLTTDESGTFLPNSIIYLRIADGDGNGSPGNSALLSYLSRDGDGVWSNFDSRSEVIISMTRTEEGDLFEFDRMGSDILEIEVYLNPTCSRKMPKALEDIGNIDQGEERIELALSCNEQNEQEDTPMPTATVTATPTEVPEEPTATVTATATATSTEVPEEPTATVTATATATSTEVPEEPTATVTATATATSTDVSEEPTATVTATATATSTEVPEEPTATVTATATATSTEVPEEPTATVTATATATSTDVPEEPTATATEVPTATPTSTPTAIPTTVLVLLRVM